MNRFEELHTTFMYAGKRRRFTVASSCAREETFVLIRKILRKGSDQYARLPPSGREDEIKEASPYLVRNVTAFPCDYKIACLSERPSVEVLLSRLLGEPDSRFSSLGAGSVTSLIRFFGKNACLMSESFLPNKRIKLVSLPAPRLNWTNQLFSYPCAVWVPLVVLLPASLSTHCGSTVCASRVMGFFFSMSYSQCVTN